jgi:hypothetical protein
MAATPFYQQIDSTKKFRLLTEKKDAAGNVYKYLKGVASLASGDAVTYDEAGVTTLLAANAKGPVAFAMSVNTSTTAFSWFGVSGTFTVNGAANSADNATIGRETTDGKVGDGRAAGDEIGNCFARSATTAAGNMTVQCSYPFVNDFLGA